MDHIKRRKIFFFSFNTILKKKLPNYDSNNCLNISHKTKGFLYRQTFKKLKN